MGVTVLQFLLECVVWRIFGWLLLAGQVVRFLEHAVNFVHVMYDLPNCVLCLEGVVSIE